MQTVRLLISFAVSTSVAAAVALAIGAALIGAEEIYAHSEVAVSPKRDSEYSAQTTRAELSREAIRLGRLLLDHFPEPEVMGLLGLMLLQESRCAARSPPEGELILLDQKSDRRRHLAHRAALASRRFGAYTLQAAIAAAHAEGSSAASTVWRQIRLPYDRLIYIQPSPVIELNRAVAVAMSEGPEQGLRLAGARGTRPLSPRPLRPCGFVSRAGTNSGGALFV